MYLWNIFGVSDEKAAKVAGIVTWVIKQNTGKTVADALNKLKELFDEHGLSADEKQFGWLIAGIYILAVRHIGAEDTTAIIRWYSEVTGASDELEINIKKYMKMFTKEM